MADEEKVRTAYKVVWSENDRLMSAWVGSLIHHEYKVEKITLYQKLLVEYKVGEKAYPPFGGCLVFDTFETAEEFATTTIGYYFRIFECEVGGNVNLPGTGNEVLELSNCRSFVRAVEFWGGLYIPMWADSATIPPGTMCVAWVKLTKEVGAHE